MASVVSDSSVLIHLANIGRLDLLRQMYCRVSIPMAVWREVVEEGRGRAGAREVEAAKDAGWIEVEAVSNELILRLLKRDLDDGEAEAITLAVQRQAALLLVDELGARRIAELYRVRKTGTVGLLIRAKREGRIESLRVELDKLRHEGGFWLEEALCQKAMAAVGEGGY